MAGQLSLKNYTMQKRHVLLSVIGMTPAVVTESLFGLYKNDNIRQGDIHIITTSIGKEKVEPVLRGGDGQDGQLEKFNQAYQTDWRLRPIEVITDKSGNPLADLRSTEDNLSMANFIFSRVRELTTNDDIILHASLAGGRKTMGYFLGQTMSWLARPCDDLSHVLVPEEYEKPGFFFPAAHETALQDQIDYAPQPFVKMGKKFQDLVKNYKEISYEDAVRIFQGYLQDQSGEGHIRLKLSEKTIYLENSKILTLPSQLMALYLFLCEYANQEINQEPFYPESGSFEHRNHIAECMARCDVKPPRGNGNKGLSMLVHEDSRWPEHWKTQGSDDFQKLRKNDLSKSLSELKSSFPDYTFKVYHDHKRKNSSYCVKIERERLTIQD